MSQEQIYNFLVENKEKYTAKEIQLNLGLKEQACFNNLRRLVKKKEIMKEDHKYWIEQS